MYFDYGDCQRLKQRQRLRNRQEIELKDLTAFDSLSKQSNKALKWDEESSH